MGRRLTVTAWIGFAIIAAYLAMALFAHWIAPYGESEIVGEQFAPWSAANLLGTDQLGRDMFSRLIYGARNTVSIAFVTTALAFTLGGALGIAAAIVGGVTDQILSRAIDILMAIPQLIFALVLLVIFGNSVPNLILIIAALDSSRVFRLSRAVALNVVVQDYIEIARLQGEKLSWIAFREVLPNVFAPLLTEFGMRFCFVFLTLAALSFLGLGIQPPTADWGSMVRETATLINYGDITPLLPAAAIALLTIGINLVVDWALLSTDRTRD
jgi:peptide/nickel transport system permease protein